ncbi:hypothetical protein M2283_010342 [Streptomyces pseudovenezuelae]|uniref:Uncharacterized protein n=1 Tax=Streptomyces pseudovenezuelae TaxID=67350 RepID=A0ABT6M366_9ACTN|nr:hypothetical protein [Streptomyces pseudovenezuelae]
MQFEPRVFRQPGFDRRGFVGAVVVDDQVDLQVGGHLLVDPDQELLELRGPVPAVQGRDDFAGGDVERGEQGGQTVADVVLGAPLRHARHARHYRQHRLGPVQRLGESAAGISPAAALRVK